MATRYDRNRQQWITEFEQTGIRVYRRHPPGIGKPQAEAWEVKRRREIYDRVDLDRKPDLTIGDAIDLWLNDNRRKNQKQAASEAKQWEPWRGRLLKDAPEVAGEAVKEWTRLRSVSSPSRVAGSRRTARASVPMPSTLNRRIMMLKAVCKAMWRQKHIPENLSGRIQTLREPPHKELYLTKAQISSLASCAPTPSCAAAIWLLAYSGLRASELLALPKMPTRSATLMVAQSKNGKARSVPLAGPARRYSSALPLEYSYWSLRKDFLIARKKAGLPKTVTLHTLRHTAASWLINAGVDLYVVGKVLGHSSPQTTQRYAHLSTQTLEKAMARLK
jgi:integrase